ncbi:MAG: NERD domain-containing protein [Pseudomonadota bacterium]|nr:NERD domain-containing protein [Pseudomonadota bacterium]
MAQLFPALEQVRQFKVRPEEGELHLLDFLDQTLGNDYEVYFQPFLNGDRPDIVVMRRGSGVLLIEVKDWDLSRYSVDSNGNWYFHAEGRHPKKSPFEQVWTYRDNLLDLHIEHLLERQLENSKLLATVACAVYFHRADQSRLDELCGQVKYVELLTPDSLTEENFERILRRTWLSRTSAYFDEDLYNRFQRYLRPPRHTRDQGKEPNYTPKQKALSESRPVQQKIRGVAGSGKTRVLARRAVNAHLRTGDRVLLLTFNITPRNYIHDAISEIREDFGWSNFYIINYHQFFNTEANNHSLPIQSLADYQNERFFEPVKAQITKFGAVLIDKIQDYKSEWIRIVKNYFLREGSEFVVFGDEKQNVYQRALGEDKRPNTTIPGAWNELNDSFRSASPVIHLAFEYQDRFFQNRYSLDEIEIPEQEGLFAEEQRLRYLSLAPDAPIDEVFIRVREVLEEWHVHPNDVGALSSRIEPLRDLDHLFRTVSHERTSTTFESREQWDDLQNREDFERVRDKLRNNKKLHFWMNPGTVKLSTIYSFKGWEIDSLILLIEEGTDSENPSDDELVYTAITRCRNNLLVLNMGNPRYHDFFERHIGTR